jgi:probable F420-dependent oxidoreductase
MLSSSRYPIDTREVTVKIGLLIFPSDHDSSASADIAVLAQRAEELGYDSIWAPEHPIIPVHMTTPSPYVPGGAIPDFYNRINDPFVALARASAVTTTIKLGTAICLIPERNPLVLAKEVATLDYFSGGRFMFGIGAGWLREETEIMGGNFPQKWGQTREAVRAMKELWTKDEAEFHGRHYDFPLVRSFPRPVQKPHPPIFMGGNAINAFKRTVEWGDGWIPTRLSAEQVKRGRETLNELATEAGRDPRSIQVVAVGAPPDPEALKAYEEAGADAAVMMLPSQPQNDPMEDLEQIAARVLA